MIILDTSVLSALMRQAPDKKAVAWLDHQPRTSVWTTSVSLLEIRYALQIFPAGKRRSLLMRAFEALLDKIEQRIVAFDAAAAQQAIDLLASRHKRGRRGDLRDVMIAGTALAHHAALATRHTAHFDDVAVTLIDPWAT
jgi:hypothetical protein